MFDIAALCSGENLTHARRCDAVLAEYMRIAVGEHHWKRHGRKGRHFLAPVDSELWASDVKRTLHRHTSRWERRLLMAFYDSSRLDVAAQRDLARAVALSGYPRNKKVADDILVQWWAVRIRLGKKFRVAGVA